MRWHCNLDSIYRRPPKTIGEAIEQEISDATGNDPGTGIIEDLRREHDRLVQIVKVFADIVLTDEQEMMLGKALGFKEAE